MKKKEEIEIIDNDVPKKKYCLRKNKIIFLVIGLIVLVMSSFFVINYYHKKKLEEERHAKIVDIKSHYDKYVKVIKDTKLLRKNNDNYEEVGTIYQDVFLNLKEIDIDENSNYLPIQNSDYYIKYSDVEKALEEKKDLRYKNYLVFNKNVVTKENYTLYKDDKKVYSFKEENEFPIIINDYEGRYYVEYDNELLSIKKDDVKEIKDTSNTKDVNQKKITTLAYHQVADEGENCKDLYICIKKNNFDKEMKYLKDNNYFTLTMEELYLYLTGHLQIKKGVVLTFDDGYKTNSTIEILEKYDLMGTVFVITSHFKDLSIFKSDNLLVQSHTHNMHRNYVCSGGNQGGALLCASEKTLKEDLETSIKQIGNEHIALAFPFYDYNEKAIKVLKEVGFKLSFIGRGGTMGKATPKVTNLYKVPRMTVWEESIMPFNDWKSYL